MHEALVSLTVFLEWQRGICPPPGVQGPGAMPGPQARAPLRQRLIALQQDIALP